MPKNFLENCLLKDEFPAVIPQLSMSFSIHLQAKHIKKYLKGLSHEIFPVIFWIEWIYLGLNDNRYWFLNFKEGSSILDSYFKY
jgi:hypothetical protein